jgi:hypothetical protein
MKRLAQAGAAAKMAFQCLRRLSSMALSSSLNPFANGLRAAECETRDLVFSHENDPGIVLRIDYEFFKDFGA